MDIYRFINSIDIAKYLKDIRYQFSTLETAWLIWQCKTSTMLERHAAWKKLIQTMPDCRIAGTSQRAGWDSLHQMLRDYMELEIKLRTILEEDDDPATVYLFGEYGPINGEKSDWYGNDLCKDFLCAFECSMDMEEAVPYRISKRWLGSAETLTAYYDINGNLLGFESVAFEQRLSDREGELLWETFDNMYFDFPIPFQKGDLVQTVFRKEAFVLMDITPWRVKRQAATENHRISASYDMYAFGYSYDEQDHFLWDDYMTDYMDLESCTEPLKGHERILEAYSRFEKGEIDAWTLLRFARMYPCEEIAAADHRRLKSFGAAR